jgi:hypothetical protein
MKKLVTSNHSVNVRVYCRLIFCPLVPTVPPISGLHQKNVFLISWSNGPRQTSRTRYATVSPCRQRLPAAKRRTALSFRPVPHEKQLELKLDEVVFDPLNV